MRPTDDIRSRAATRSRVRRNARRPAPSAKPRTGRIVPRWVPVVASLSLVVMITATINFRAYTELREEEKQNTELNQQVQQMTTENLNLQEEIYYLKNDSRTIEREAKKYGLVPRKPNSSRAGEIESAEGSTNRRKPTQ
jgi:cell division protein FtsL